MQRYVWGWNEILLILDTHALSSSSSSSKKGAKYLSTIVRNIARITFRNYDNTSICPIHTNLYSLDRNISIDLSQHSAAAAAAYKGWLFLSNFMMIEKIEQRKKEFLPHKLFGKVYSFQLHASEQMREGKSLSSIQWQNNWNEWKAKEKLFFSTNGHHFKGEWFWINFLIPLNFIVHQKVRVKEWKRWKAMHAWAQSNWLLVEVIYGSQKWKTFNYNFTCGLSL